MNRDDKIAEFEKEYPDFDWRNIRPDRHPNGIDCKCPMHEFLREKGNIQTMLERELKEQGRDQEAKDLKVVFKLCAPHYDQLEKELAEMNWIARKLYGALMKLGKVQWIKLSVMLSEECMFCRFGSGEFKKTELPPPPTA